jgi:hypothetical protein
VPRSRKACSLGCVGALAGAAVGSGFSITRVAIFFSFTHYAWE